MDREVHCRVTRADKARVGALAARYGHVLSASDVVRVALRIGLEAIERDERVLLSADHAEKTSA